MTYRDSDGQIDLPFARPARGSPHREPDARRAHARPQERPESAAWETEARLRDLETHYRAALSRAVAAKARYLALMGDPSATPAAIKRAYRRWQLLQLQRKAFATRMAAIESRQIAEVPSNRRRGQHEAHSP